MNVEQRVWSATSEPSTAPLNPETDLVFLFGAPSALRGAGMARLRQECPSAELFGCSTAGEIAGTRVHDDALVITGVRFSGTRVRSAQVSIEDPSGSRRAGAELARRLAGEELAHVMVLSDGLHVNGSELVAGLTASLPAGVTITGGLAADGDRFGETLVVGSDGATAQAIVALGWYGRNLRVHCASLGGWDPFGPERLVTNARGNLLFELDGHPALDLYRSYLGEYAAGLPATGLLFPLSVREPGSETPVVRTILGIDEEARSLTFAGDIPQGSVARLMTANLDRLVDGAAGAATRCVDGAPLPGCQLAILISCVGRRLVLKQRVEEELEAVRDILGPEPHLTGFYSYGEISPFTPNARCELHNQTMTITTFDEE